MAMILGKIRSVLISIVTVCSILGIAALIIAYGRGYRLDFTKKSFKSTGLLVINSEPTGAQILINGKVTSATAATLTLAPDWYQITLSKEGYQNWEKRVRLQGEVVNKIEALLLPVNPSLTALTATGVVKPVLSPDGAKLAFIIPENHIATNGGQLSKKPGIWILDLLDKPLGLNRDARQISNSYNLDLDQTSLSWSPDSKQVLACQKLCTLLENDKLNESPKMLSDAKTLLSEWEQQTKLREKEKLTGYPQEFVNLATSSAKILAFSPDESKVLYEATKSASLAQIITPPFIGANGTPEIRELKPNNLYIYDLKEDRNYPIGEIKNLPVKNLSWLPTSKHILIVQKDKIEIMEYDGSNRKTFYAGPFSEGFAAAWANASKIVVLTNLNPSASNINNLYAINLKF